MLQPAINSTCRLLLCPSDSSKVRERRDVVGGSNFVVDGESLVKLIWRIKLRERNEFLERKIRNKLYPPSLTYQPAWIDFMGGLDDVIFMSWPAVLDRRSLPPKKSIQSTGKKELLDLVQRFTLSYRRPGFLLVVPSAAGKINCKPLGKGILHHQKLSCSRHKEYKLRDGRLTARARPVNKRKQRAGRDQEPDAARENLEISCSY